MTGFGLDHLPYGIFSVAGGPRRVGVRFEEGVVDLHAATGRPEFDSPSLNAFMGLGTEVWRQTRDEVRGLAGSGSHTVPLDELTLHLPVEVADYVDFYASLDHATNVGQDVPARRRRAHAELAAPADRLPRTGGNGRRVRDAGHRPSGQRRRPATRRRPSGPLSDSTSRPSSASSSVRRRRSGRRCRSPASPTTSSA